MKPLLKGIVVVALLTGTAIAIWIQFDDRIKREEPPPSSYLLVDKFKAEGVPDFEVVDLNGKPQKLSQLKGSVIVLSFWATWCSPCVEEFPSMMSMLKKLQDKGVVMVGVAADQDKAEVEKFVKMNGGDKLPAFYNWWDPSLRVPELFGTEKIPETYVIGKDMKLIRKFSSVEVWDSDDMITWLKSL